MAWHIQNLALNERTLVECNGVSLTLKMQAIHSTITKLGLNGTRSCHGAVLLQLNTRRATDVVIVERVA